MWNRGGGSVAQGAVFNKLPGRLVQRVGGKGLGQAELLVRWWWWWWCDGVSGRCSGEVGCRGEVSRKQE